MALKFAKLKKIFKSRSGKSRDGGKTISVKASRRRTTRSKKRGW